MNYYYNQFLKNASERENYGDRMPESRFSRKLMNTVRGFLFPTDRLNRNASVFFSLSQTEDQSSVEDTKNINRFLLPYRAFDWLTNIGVAFSVTTKNPWYIFGSVVAKGALNQIEGIVMRWDAGRRYGKENQIVPPPPFSDTSSEESVEPTVVQTTSDDGITVISVN